MRGERKVTKKAYPLVLITIGILAASVSVAQANWSEIASGYAITCDWHGVDILPGTLVTATAGTTDASVSTITFQWKDPADNIVKTETIDVASNGTTYNDKLVYWAHSSYAPDSIGKWTVKAIFNGANKNGNPAQRAQSVHVCGPSNVVPDIPVIGTAGALVTMFASLGMFLRKKRL